MAMTEIPTNPKYFKYNTHVDYDDGTDCVTIQFWIHEHATDGVSMAIYLASETAQELVAAITKALQWGEIGNGSDGE